MSEIQKVKLNLTEEVFEPKNIEKKIRTIKEDIEKILMDNKKVLQEGKYIEVEGNNVLTDIIQNAMWGVIELKEQELIKNYKFKKLKKMVISQIEEQDVIEYIKDKEAIEKLKYIIKEKLKDNSWTEGGEFDDFEDTYRRYKNGSVKGLFYLDTKIIEDMMKRISLLNKKIEKTEKKIDTLEKKENAIKTIEDIKINEELYIDIKSLKSIANIKLKNLKKDEKKIKGKLEEQIKKLEKYIELLEAKEEDYEKITTYGYQTEPGEIVDIVSNSNDYNCYQEKVVENSLLVNTLVFLNEIEEKNTMELLKDFKSTFDLRISNKKTKQNSRK